MHLAKPALDVGLYTNQLAPMLEFWQQQAGVPFAELLKVGGGVHQHRHAIGQSVLKINHQRDELPSAPPTGFRRLEVYTGAVQTSVECRDPDGNDVTLRPQLVDTPNLRLHLQTPNLSAMHSFYGETLALERTNDTEFAIGDSRLSLGEGSVSIPVERAGIGYRYITLQVYDVVGVHRHILAQGGTEGMAPVRLGEVAYISFVRDPDGNWIEISQRKSLTGSLA